MAHGRRRLTQRLTHLPVNLISCELDLGEHSMDQLSTCCFEQSGPPGRHRLIDMPLVMMEGGNEFLYFGRLGGYRGLCTEGKSLIREKLRGLLSLILIYPQNIHLLLRAGEGNIELVQFIDIILQ